MPLELLTGAFALTLAAVHIVAGRLRFLDVIPRSRWLSLAGGVSVAYVFVHLLPELGRGQEVVGGSGLPLVAALENHVYLMALLGLGLLYGLERSAKVSRDKESPSNEVFWPHVASYSAYNALIGHFLLHRIRPELMGLLLFAVAMGLQFVVNDFGLRHDYGQAHHRVGRWILALAVLVGWGFGLLGKVHEAAPALLFAFLAGGLS